MSGPTEAPTLSIVVPAYDEEECVGLLVERLERCLARELAGTSVEVIVADDHSRDRTPSILRELIATRPWLRTVRLLKNSGSHAAILAGLSRARGRYAFIMGADLQDPPELIPKFLEAAARGYHVVLGERTSRDDPWYRTIPSIVFNRIVRWSLGPVYPRSGSDVFLLDDLVVREVVRGAEKNANVFVLILSTCDDVTRVPYARACRVAGRSKFTFGRLLKLAYDTFLTLGYLPLRFILWLGIGTFVLSLAIIAWVTVSKLRGTTTAVGWPSLVAAVLGLGALNLLSISILGEYLWRTLEQSKKRPAYVVESEA